jgi:hypothetical protein
MPQNDARIVSAGPITASRIIELLRFASETNSDMPSSSEIKLQNNVKTKSAMVLLRSVNKVKNGVIQKTNPIITPNAVSLGEKTITALNQVTEVSASVMAIRKYKETNKTHEI